MQQKEVILEGTIKAFNEKGLKFTMDDVAKILGMSKKTIYTVFRDKESMFLAMVDYMFDSIKESEQQIVEDNALSTVEKIRRILGVIPESYRDVDFRQLYLLKDKYPVIYKQVEKRLETGWETTIQLLEQGMAEGVIRKVSIPIVKCAHGVLPVPAPATAELLRGIPFYTGSVTGELLTPTGAAILHYYVLRYLPMPTMTASEIGYGIGSKDFGIANCVRAFLGDTASYLAAEEEPYSCDDTILSISCNIDDMTGEALGLATEIFMAAGALDVFTIPIQMKKNRPGILLTCLCEMEEREKFTGLFFLHTSTRGVRYQVFERAKLESTFETRKTSYGNIRIKKSSGYGIQKEKAEFEDLKSVVLKNHCALSLNEVEKSLH